MNVKPTNGKQRNEKRTPWNFGNAIILVADDDSDDRFLIETAFESSNVSCDLRFVTDGVQLMKYLLGPDGKIEAADNLSRPSVVVLDLNMPKKDGRTALSEIRANPDLKDLPVVILTTSDLHEDISYCNNLGISGFFTKPVTVEGWSEFVNSVLETCSLFNARLQV